MIRLPTRSINYLNIKKHRPSYQLLILFRHSCQDLKNIDLQQEVTCVLILTPTCHPARILSLYIDVSDSLVS